MYETCGVVECKIELTYLKIGASYYGIYSAYQIKIGLFVDSLLLAPLAKKILQFLRKGVYEKKEDRNYI